MAEVTVRELRNHGGRVLERVSKGETLTVTLDGRPVAELRPLSGRGLSGAELLRRRRVLPTVDPQAMRRDLDLVIDGSV